MGSLTKLNTAKRACACGVPTQTEPARAIAVLAIICRKIEARSISSTLFRKSFYHFSKVTQRFRQ
jgi:hypothetical protein